MWWIGKQEASQSLLLTCHSEPPGCVGADLAISEGQRQTELAFGMGAELVQSCDPLHGRALLPAAGVPAAGFLAAAHEEAAEDADYIFKVVRDLIISLGTLLYASRVPSQSRMNRIRKWLVGGALRTRLAWPAADATERRQHPSTSAQVPHEGLSAGPKESEKFNKLHCLAISATLGLGVPQPSFGAASHPRSSSDALGLETVML